MQLQRTAIAQSAIDHAAARPAKTVRGAWYLLALIFPLLGFIAGIYWLAKNQVGPGLALFATSFLGVMVNLMLFGV